MRSSPLLLVIALTTLPATARADGDTDAATARALAEDGLQAVRAGNDKDGCPKLIEAWKLDSTLLGAGFAAAGCHERKGDLATAWATYGAVAGKAEARHDARAEEARAHADALKPRLSTLTIVAPTDVASLPGLVVRRNQISIGPAAFGTTVPVDGGSYEIGVSATGRGEWTQRVEVPSEGGRVEVTLQAPPALAATTPIGTPARPSPPDPTPPTPSRPDAPRSIGGLGIAAIALGVGGAIGMGIGIGLGVKADSDYHGVAGCNDKFCDSASAATQRSALGLADAGTGTFIAGAVLGATSVVLGILAATTAPSSSKGIALTPRGIAF
ncbi:MAG: hypothetical protein U0414_29440 [Polyangiaceae bacterium]